jgi:putative ABC transport system substrate-binding protein
MRYRMIDLSLVCALAMTLPGLAAAQSSASKVPRVGLLAWGPCDVPAFVAGRGEFGPFVLGLDELGYTPGQTVAIEAVARGGETKVSLPRQESWYRFLSM